MVVELKLNQSMMHSTRPITFMVIVKYLSLSSEWFYNSSSHTNFLIGAAKMYPNRKIVIVPPPVMALMPK